MKRFYNYLISMQLMIVLLITYAVTMAIATFIENDYGAAVAKHVVYNTWWFELIQFLLAVNMVGNIFKYKLYKKQKLSILAFHLAFIIILIGAGTTRYLGFEGMMHIREGETNNKFQSEKTYFQVTASENNEEKKFEKAVFMSPYIKTKFNEDIDLQGKTVNIELKKIIPNAEQKFVEAGDGRAVIEMVFSSNNGMDSYFLEDNSSMQIMGIDFFLNKESHDNAVNFTIENNKLYFQSAYELKSLSMGGGRDTVFQAGLKHELQIKQLYDLNNLKFVIKSYSGKSKISYIAGDIREGINYNVLAFNVHSGNETKELHLVSANGGVGRPVLMNINGINLKFEFGAKEMILPFSLRLNDFQLDRYPGSESPSSYASEVMLIDENNHVSKEHRIFMNNVLEYQGYRFYQSSYDKDEKGTILSVNHDKAGTLITYFGYFLLSLGMFWSIFNKSSHFIELARKTSEIRNKRKGLTTAIIILFLFGSQLGHAQDNSIKNIDKEHARVFGKLLIQDQAGRIKPYTTLTSQFLRKISRKEKFDGLNSNQVFLGMIFYPEHWKNVKMIKVSHPELIKLLGAEGKYVSFNQLVNLEKREYKLKAEVQKAFEKQPAQRNKFDKDVIAVDERLNLVYQIFSGKYLSVFPIPGDVQKKWLNPSENKAITDSVERNFVATVFSNYYNEVIKANKSGDWSGPDKIVESIIAYQKRYAAEILPSETKQKMEIQYINFNIFERIDRYYGLVGFILLIVLFIGILKPKMKINVVANVAAILLGLLFLFHTYGLGVRWYISGHAPWSNGYESMIYIAWATMLAGFIFMKRSPVSLAATALLASIILMVAHLSWMDPEITNLVPVLKSYWLTIHVSVITASYGFLALGALLGLLSLVLMIFKTKNNVAGIELTLSELTNVNHMSLIIGLYLLTIGTFLGGVWANESWGRYWGWDPKETWALITIIVYSIVGHLRFIPFFNNKYAFNLASLLSFGSVLMTYFGVNYYLSGLHSYASGDPMPIPDFVTYTLVAIAIVAVMAYIRNVKIGKPVLTE